MALPQAAPSPATTLPCKNKYAISVIAQKIKEILNFTATIVFPVAINKGGTGGITTPAARIAFALPTTDLAAATIIDWGVTTNFYNSIVADKSYTMTAVVDGLSIQLLILNSHVADITPTFPVGVKWVGGAIPGVIATGEYGLYSFTSINGNIVGVIGDSVA